MSKSLTKDCPDCSFLVNQGKNQSCSWGNNKKVKRLLPNRVTRLVRSKCTLKH